MFFTPFWQFIHCNCDPDFKDICIYFVTYPAITYFVFETSFRANLLHVIPVFAIKWLNFMWCSKSPITFEIHTLHHTTSIRGPRFTRWRPNKVSDETFAPQPQPIEPQPNKMFLLCLFLQIKVVKGKIQTIYIKGVLLTLINWINITNNIPNMVKNTR